jgi:hypothetical protein
MGRHRRQRKSPRDGRRRYLIFGAAIAAPFSRFSTGETKMTTRKTHDDWDSDETAKSQPAAEKPPVAAGHVRVKCIVDNRPHTDTKALEKGEEADVSEEIAAAMIKRGQVEKV